MKDPAVRVFSRDDGVASKAMLMLCSQSSRTMSFFSMKQHSLLNEMAHSVTAKWLWTLNPHDMTSLIISKYVRNVLILEL